MDSYKPSSPGKPYIPLTKNAPTLDSQSYLLDREHGIHASMYITDGPLPYLRSGKYATLLETFEVGVSISRNEPCLGWRSKPMGDYVWMTYQEMYDTVKDLGSGLLQLNGITPGTESCIGIYALNCPEWILTQHACIMFRLITVPIYNTLGTEASQYIMKQTQMKVVVVDTLERVKVVLNDLDNRMNLKYIICVEESEEIQQLAEKYAERIKILTFAEILKKGKEKPHAIQRPLPSDLVLICYTSGTTGTPKGVMITHKNMVASACGFEYFNAGFINKNTVHLSYLPLAHTLEQATTCFLLGVGAKVGFYSGKPELILDDMAALRPTLLMAVPRVLSRIYSKVQGVLANSYIKSKLFEWGIYYKMKYLEEGIVTRNTWWDTLVFSKIQNMLGGRLELIYCGGAPLSPEILRFARASLGCHVYEGYGASETSSGITTNLVGEWRCDGSVGPPIANCHIKLIDVPEMGLVAKRDNKGEVCVKSPVCTKGYYKDPLRTKELIDEEGWLHLGDVGEWTKEGGLRIVDRCKNIFKLSQGDYVAPEKVEMVYTMSRFVHQIFVEGNSLQSYPVAIVVPDQEIVSAALLADDADSDTLGLGAWNSKTFSSPNDWSQNAASEDNEEEFAENGMLPMRVICSDPRTETIILDDMNRLAQENELKGFEQVKVIRLIAEPFSIENGILTPTMKACRQIVRRRYAKEIEAMYMKKESGRI